MNITFKFLYYYLRLNEHEVWRIMFERTWNILIKVLNIPNNPQHSPPPPSPKKFHCHEYTINGHLPCLSILFFHQTHMWELKNIYKMREGTEAKWNPNKRIPIMGLFKISPHQ